MVCDQKLRPNVPNWWQSYEVRPSITHTHIHKTHTRLGEKAEPSSLDGEIEDGCWFFSDTIIIVISPLIFLFPIKFNLFLVRLRD